MRILITGAGGFLGSHLALHYLNNDNQVFGVDNFCSSDENSVHTKKLLSHKQFTLIERDICDDWRQWEPQLDGKIDLVLNFACPASPPQYQAMPVLTMMTCVVGTSNMLDLTQKHGAIFVQASTSEIYGEPLRSLQNEQLKSHVNSYGPRACYDAGKMAAEALCYDYLHAYGVDVRMARIFNTYGPHMDPYDGRVVSNFICQALRSEKLTIYGDGSQGRSFCYVDDLIRGITALGSLAQNPGGPVNLGTPHEYSVKELADTILKKVYGDSVRPRFGLNDPNMVDYKPLPVDDPTQRCPDITRAKELLGWEPKVQLAEGLDKTIMYFRDVVKR